MVFADRIAEVGREPVQVFELDWEFCDNTYGTAPCVASVGVTGTRKCFNTRFDCQDPQNFTSSTRTFRFCEAINRASELTAIPAIVNVQRQAAEITEDVLGTRGRLIITLQDFPWSDRYPGGADLDKYIADRSYNPEDQGTFWRKFIARFPNYAGRACRLKTGYMADPFTFDDFKTRYYIMERIEGPDSNNLVRIIAKDTLKLADNNRALAPVPSTGRVATALTAGGLSLMLGSGEGAQYGSSGRVRVGDEIIEFNSRSTDTLTDLERGQNNTTAVAHSVGEAVQLCLEYTNQTPDLIAADLLENYANVPAAQLDTAQWATEAADWFPTYFLSTLITEPTGVRDLLEEMSGGMAKFYWDDTAQAVKMKAVRPAQASEVTALTDDDLVDDFVQVDRLAEERLTRVYVKYDQIDPTKEKDENANYNTRFLFVNADAESPELYGDKRQKTYVNRFMKLANESAVSEVASRQLSRNKNERLEVMFVVDASQDLQLGDFLQLTIRDIEDATGSDDSVNFMITSIQENKTGHSWKIKAVSLGFDGRYANIMDNLANDFSSATDTEKDTGGYITADTGYMADGTEGYLIQ